MLKLKERLVRTSLSKHIFVLSGISQLGFYSAQFVSKFGVLLRIGIDQQMSKAKSHRFQNIG